MFDNEDGNGALIAQLAAAGIAVKTVEGGNTPFALVPDGFQTVSLAEFVQNDRSERPYRIKQNVEVWDAASFVEYFLKFRDDDSRVFADVNAATVTALIDYHEGRIAVEGIESHAAAPRWGSHKLTLALKKSAEWLLWISQNKKAMDQDTFATFIEDNAPDINEPSAATMKEIATDLHETQDLTFASKAVGPNGSAKLTYSNEVKTTFGKAAATVPESFKVAIPVYTGGGLVQLVARLRTRVNNGKVSFWYDLLRADAAERAAFDHARGEIGSAIGSQIISGVVR
jgi:uncharacterized protein YfdQ (DUF2303 family)